MVAAIWWPHGEDDPVWRTYDDPRARQVEALGTAREAVAGVDPVLGEVVPELVAIRLAQAAIDLGDAENADRVIPKLNQAAEAGALGIVRGRELAPEWQSVM